MRNVAQSRIRSLSSIATFGVFLLLCSDLSAQTITEFALPERTALPTKIVAGADGNLWFIESRTVISGWPKIGRITTAGSVVEFDVPAGSVSLPNDIVSGPDGNIWFTQCDIDGGHSAVNRMTPAGVLANFATERVFPGPFPSFTGPLGITAGPDGNLWVTFNEANAIGRYTPDGVLANAFSVPTPGSRPMGITAGPDANLWFTESSGNKIGRITTAGEITEYAVPTAASRPSEITVGPDGNLWFTEGAAARIGRITPSGAVTEFPIPTRSFGLTPGPDGNIWFTQFETARIGRITLSGVVTEIPIPAPAAGITAGPDGNIWFTEFGPSRIGRLALARAPAIDSRILPVVGSTVGAINSFFRTAVQLHNPTTATISGRVVFHTSGTSGADSDPAVGYFLQPGQTQSIADLLPAMGRSGLGSADIEVTAGGLPTAVVRVFNDAGTAGTTGFTEEPMRGDDSLSPGSPAVLILPEDLTRYRFNVGVRTLAARVSATLTLRDASGAILTTLSRAFPETYHEQRSAAEFLGVPALPAGGSISIAMTDGPAIFYGATVDNTTGDPSLQIARVAP